MGEKCFFAWPFSYVISLKQISVTTSLTSPSRPQRNSCQNRASLFNLESPESESSIPIPSVSLSDLHNQQ